MDYEIWVASGRQSISSVLTYSSTNKLQVGEVIKVPFRNSFSLGIVVSRSTKFTKKTKHIHSQTGYVLSGQSIALIKWMERYYPSSISSICNLFLPSTKILGYSNDVPANTNSTTIELPPLNDDQGQIVAKIFESASAHIYIHGVTASGKTRVYSELIATAFTAGKSSIILTPEIGLTTPLQDSLSERFGTENVVGFHSNLTQKQRDLIWLKVAGSKTPQVIVGPRSALFLPINNLGLIVVDEAHDTAYKQEQQPFYSATRVAAKLATLWNIKCIFGSATPDLVDYYAFKSKKLPVFELKNTAIKNRFNRTDVVIDLKNKELFKRSAIISEPLLKALQIALQNNKQSLLFLNRRGSAKTVACRNCGWRSICPNCDVGLTYHADTNSTLCHSCSFKQQAPSKCPDCGQIDIIFSTFGTKAVEQELKKLFPNAKIARFDKDTKTGSKLHQLHSQIKSGEIDILLGTQMLAKGLDIPHLGVVGLLQADISMSLPDFSSSEKTYQLVSQVAGRLNRGHGDGELFIQTMHPESIVIEKAIKQDFTGFYASELKQRLEYGFPPAFYLLKVTVKRKTQKGAIQAAQKIYESIKDTSEVQSTPPTPCYMEKQVSKYCWQIIIRSKNRSKLTSLMAELPSSVSANIDPTDLL